MRLPVLKPLRTHAYYTHREPIKLTLTFGRDRVDPKVMGGRILDPNAAAVLAASLG
jgi:hypothetical protein